MKSKVILLNPPGYWLLSGCPHPKLVCENLGLLQIKEVIPSERFEIEYIDAFLLNLNRDQIADLVLDKKPDLLAVSIMFPSVVESCDKLFKRLRAEGFHGKICVGGHIPTIDKEYFINNSDVDAIVMGDGEVPFRHLLDIISSDSIPNVKSIPGLFLKGVTVDSERFFLPSLKSLPVPKREYQHLVEQHSGSVFVNTSRGCYGNCSFCSVRQYHLGIQSYESGYWRSRPLNEVINELTYLEKELGVRDFVFTDDNFLGCSSKSERTKRVDRFCDAVLSAGLNHRYYLSCRVNDMLKSTCEKLHLSGVRTIFLGVESGNNRDLRLFQKGSTVDENLVAITNCKNAGINVEIGFIMFTPYSTCDLIRENLMFLAQAGELRPNRLMSRLKLFPNTTITRTVNGDSSVEKVSGRFGYIFQSQEMEELYDLFEKFGRKYSGFFDEVELLLWQTYMKEESDSDLRNVALRFVDEVLNWTNSATLDFAIASLDRRNRQNPDFIIKHWSKFTKYIRDAKKHADCLLRIGNRKQ